MECRDMSGMSIAAIVVSVTLILLGCMTLVYCYDLAPEISRDVVVATGWCKSLAPMLGIKI